MPSNTHCLPPGFYDPDGELDHAYGCTRCGEVPRDIDGDLRCACDDATIPCPEGCTDESVAARIMAGYRGESCEWCHDRCVVTDEDMEAWAADNPVEHTARIARREFARELKRLIRKGDHVMVAALIHREAA